MEFKVRSPSEILASVDERTCLLARLETSANMRSGGFNKFCLPLLHSVAAYVQECPLEEDCFAEPGGLLRYALTAAFYALEISGTMVFTSSQSSETRRLLDPQYRFGVFAASIAALPAILHSRVIITDSAGSEVWSPYHSYPRIADWVQRHNGSKGYKVEWRRERLPVSQAGAIGLAADLYGVGLWQNFDLEVVQQVYEAILPPEPRGPEGKIVKCVRTGDRCAREFERNARSDPYKAASLPPGITPAAIAAIPSQASVSIPTQPTDEEAKGQIAAVLPLADEAAKAEAASEPDPSASMPAHVIEMFHAIRTRPEYEELKSTWVVSDTGIEVPVNTFSGLGRSPGAIGRELKELGTLIDFSSRTLVLKRSMHALLFGK